MDLLAPCFIALVAAASAVAPASSMQLLSSEKEVVIVSVGNQTFDVRSYGAVGDGVANDTLAVHKAFAAAAGAGGGVVLFSLGDQPQAVFLTSAFQILSSHTGMQASKTCG